MQRARPKRHSTRACDSTDQSLEDGALPAALRADDGDLREVKIRSRNTRLRGEKRAL